jgi:hypothetical protein
MKLIISLALCLVQEGVGKSPLHGPTLGPRALKIARHANYQPVTLSLSRRLRG